MAFPSNPHWEYCGFGGAGLFMQVYADPTVADKIWAVSDVAGIYVSTDKGDTWHESTIGLKYNDGSTLQQAPSSPTTFYYTTGRASYTNTDGAGFHKSTDSGASWTLKKEGVSYKVLEYGHKALAINRTDPNTVYVGNSSPDSALGGNIQRTTDGGTTMSTWKTAAQVGLGNIWAMVIDMSNTYLWVGSSSGLRRITLSDGTVQTHTLTGTNATRNSDIVACTIAGTNYIFVVAGDRIAYTTNNGSSWSYTAIMSSINSSNYAWRMAIGVGASLASTKIMVQYTTVSFSYSGGRLKSSDGGSSWSSATGTITYDTTHNPTRTYTTGVNRCHGLTVDPNNSSRFYMSDVWGIYRTDDFGVTWTEKANGNANCINNELANSPNGAWWFTCSMDAGLMRSSDYGVTWNACIPNSSQNYPTASGHHWRVVCTGTAAEWDAGNGHVIATSWPWDDSLKHKVLRSTNNGATWSILTGIGLPNTLQFGGVWNDGYLRGLAVDPNNHNIMYASIDGLSPSGVSVSGGIFKSTTNGTSWTRLTALPSSTSDWNASLKWKVYKAIAVNPTDSTNVVYGTYSGGGVYVSNNSGASFHSPTVGPNLYAVQWMKFAANGTLFACGDASGPKIWRSTDKGETWTQIWAGSPTSGPAGGLGVHPTNSNILCVGITGWASDIRADRVYATENALAANPTFTDISGDLPNGTGQESAVWAPNEGTAGYLWIARSAGGIYRMNLATSGGSSPGALTSTNVTLGTTIKSRETTHVLDFTTATSIPVDGKIVYTPSGSFTFNYGGTTAVTSATGIDGTLTVSISGNVVTITRSSGTVSTAGVKSLTLSHIQNPSTAGSTGVYEFKTTSSSGTVLDINSAVTADTITNPPALTSTNVEPASLVAGDSGNVVVSFTTSTTIPSTGKIVVTMPTSLGTGFTMNNGGTTAASGLSGLDGTLTVSIASNVITLTRAGGATNSAAGAKSFTLSFIKVPSVAGSTGTYQIKTTDTDGVTIDEDTAVTADTITSAPSGPVVMNFQNITITGIKFN